MNTKRANSKSFPGYVIRDLSGDYLAADHRNFTRLVWADESTKDIPITFESVAKAREFYIEENTYPTCGEYIESPMGHRFEMFPGEGGN